MNCRGIFVFKSFTYREGGTFKNDKGEELPYKSAYVLKVDEISADGEVNERKFKIAEDKTKLINDFNSFEIYDKIELTFKVSIYTSRVGLEITGVELAGDDL